MAVVLRYVNKRGIVLERFIGIVHVRDTCASSLKEAITSLLGEHNLSLSRIRGQGYDGASNMNGPFNGLKSLILRENPTAYYIHCFAHQLQLALVYVARRNDEADWFFVLVNKITNVMKGSAKRRELIREKQTIQIIEGLSHGDLQTGSGSNQELGFRRPCETRWGSHYSCILNLIANFSCIADVLGIVGKDSTKQEQKAEANRLKKFMEDFDFVLMMHLMKNVLGITNELSLALQKKDQDIENAMSLVMVAK
ncbi:General transcription factor 2-related zinc finger protein [Rhynchospora pubera]|uniref:General transcription factor 2-related zinc finger protein n=1 Tax=Rhynchospora pubera TaxID=906938 RepID=A0AAV8GXT1_9POAL|nr:General transcription factor 2-related zinc finger protein [Rhynchospora pubera]